MKIKKYYPGVKCIEVRWYHWIFLWTLPTNTIRDHEAGYRLDYKLIGTTWYLISSSSKETEEKLAKSEARIAKLRCALECYCQPKRDQSFEGWEKEWRYIKPMNDHDYEFYPNHDSALEAIRSDDEAGVENEKRK